MLNRRVTGFLAWGALAAIIAVPSAEVVLKKGDAEPSILQAQATDPTKFFGPMPKQPVAKTDFGALNPASSEQEPVVDEAEAAPIETPAVDPAPLRIVGDTGAAIAPQKAAPKVTKPAEAVKAIETAKSEPVKEPIDKANLSADVEIAPILDSEKDKLSAGMKMAATQSNTLTNPVTSKSDGPVVLEPTKSSAAQTAAINPVMIAPQPMPASMRPPAPARYVPPQQAVANVSLENDVQQSINNIRATRRPAPPPPIQVIEPSGGQIVIFGGNPGYDGGQRLEPFRNGEFYDDEYAGDSEFYQQWQRENGMRPEGRYRVRGSFAEQVPPPRRGNGIRLDLLQ